MKCQRCPKPATFHITDIERGKRPKEFHFCEEHARLHLAPSAENGDKSEMSSLAEKLSQGGLEERPARVPRPTSKPVRSAR